jgi:hypothetical protein
MSEKATLNFDISKELNDLVELETKRLEISKADFIRMRLVEYFEVKNASNKFTGVESAGPEAG